MSWNKKNIENTTFFNIKYYEKMKLKVKNYEEDLKRDKRSSEQLCKYCYYLRNDTVSGSAFTSYNCAICNSEESNSDTNTDKLCKNCSKENNICKHCGGELD